MPFKKELPEWNAPGIVPSEEAKKSGWGPNQHPPADWFNWQWNLTYQALKELQENAQHINDSVSIADASITQKGITQLNDKVDSDSTTQAATANAVKKVNDAVVTHSADDTSHVRYGTASGTNAKTINLNPKPTALVEGMALSFKNTIVNTGAVTLNVNSFGAKPVIKSNGNILSSGNLKAGSIYTVRYDGTSFILQGEGASGTAVASDLLSGKTAGSDAGDLVGTMPNKVGSGTIFTPRTSDIVIPKGYFGGDINDGKILGDLNLIADNILSGKSIFGVNGNLAPKRVASGTATSSTQYDLTVSLSFKPSVVVFYSYNGTGYYNLGVMFDAKVFYTLLNPSYKAVNGFNVQQTWAGSPNQLGLLNEETSYVLDNGFKIRVPYFSTAYEFKAIQY